MSSVVMHIESAICNSKNVADKEEIVDKVEEVLPTFTIANCTNETDGRLYNVVSKGSVPLQFKTLNNNNGRLQTVNALQRPTQKVQILSNVVMHNKNIILNKSAPFQRQVLTGKVGNGKTLVGKNTSMMIKTAAVNQKAMKTNIRSIKTLSPQAPFQKGIKTLSPQYYKSNAVKVVPTRVGIKTLAPQKPRNSPQKPNYIGKHAANAQKKPAPQKRLVQKPISPVKYPSKNAQGNFNQSLTAQILQSLPKSNALPNENYAYKKYPLQSPSDSNMSDEMGEEIKPELTTGLSYLCQVVMLDHNYGAPPPPTSPVVPRPPPQTTVNGTQNAAPGQPYYPKRNRHNSHNNFNAKATSNVLQVVESSKPQDDDAGSTISSDAGREPEPEGEETETAPEGEGDEDGVTRCICDFDHDDGYMICCDICSSWQHVDCMGLDREHIPEKYTCVRCEPRRVDRQGARAMQQRKREELAASDSASDTSTASSGDQHPLNNNLINKKRIGAPIPLARRKSEPVNRRPMNNVKRQQRRESMREGSGPRRSSMKKREKKTVLKRKMKSRSSIDDDSQDSWPTSAPNASNVGASLLQLRQWIENYEEAVTNHYSPELRARISNMRANGAQPSAPLMAQSDVAVQKCRLISQPMTSIKIVMSTMSLSQNTPVIELRGKYMLSTQHRSMSSGPGGLLTRQHAQRPGPFLFFYRLPRDNTEVCVDTRTYGNDARFIRRSCKPNAELRHCVEKGTLHLYVVTVLNIEKNTELTIKHESHDVVAAATTNVACACGNPAQCGLFTSQRKNGSTDTPEINNLQRKRRGRRISEPSQEPPSPPPEPLPSPVVVPPVITRRTSHTRTEPPEKPEAPPVPEVKDKKKKLTREERKMEAIMKAFERLEKAEQRKQEVQARQAQRRESEPSPASRENGDSDSKPRRKKRKGRSRTISTNSQGGRRRTRLNSTDSYMTSGDEGSLLSPPLPPDEKVRDESPVKMPQADIGSPAQVTTAAGLLLALANGAHHEQNLNKSPPRETDGNSSSSSIQSSPSTPLSSACLLVAAAVGPLEPGFKFPKTKKAIMNEWLNKSPEPVQPASSISPMSLQPHLGQAPPDQLAQSDYYANKSLATLVQAASLCDSPPQGRQSRQGAGSAKKRWLRQAISEECDSPCSRPESPPCSEMVAPPKKRRLARESLSSEQSFTPPTTPTMLVPPSNPLTEEDFPNNDEEFYTAEERHSAESSPSSSDFKSHLLTTEDKICKDPNRVEIVYGNHDAEELSPPQELEPDAVLKERVAEMQLEFGANVKQTDILENITLHSSVETYVSVPEFSVLDPRLGRSMFRDSSQLLGTVEKTIKFYEDNLAAAEEKEKPVEIVTPAKRKLSISEYRQRKQLNNDRSNEETSSPGSPRAARMRSDSSSSSQLSSDDEVPAPAVNPEPQIRGAVAFNSAPTAVERQRENVERLKKAFGLVLDDENRKMSRSPKSPAKDAPKEELVGYESKPDAEAFAETVSSSYIPPFNNPVYPNSVQFTTFASAIDPYEGRNPSPPPELPGRLYPSPKPSFK